jgi:hypothetical protein
MQAKRIGPSFGQIQSTKLLSDCHGRHAGRRRSSLKDNLKYVMADVWRVKLAPTTE